MEKTNVGLAKSKTPQAATPNDVQDRDLFQTPNYAVDLLIPFIPKNITWIWEPACGDGKIVQRLTERGLGVYPSDIRKSARWVNNHIHNFLTDERPLAHYFARGDEAIITNPPFSLKQQFYKKCREYNIPFALLIPADYSGWIIQATIDGCEKIIPTRRIDYITPNVLTRIHEGEVWNLVKDNYHFHHTIEELRLTAENEYSRIMGNHPEFKFDSIYDVPKELLSKYSSSAFHSMWLTWGFGLGRTETFVELSLKEKKENI